MRADLAVAFCQQGDLRKGVQALTELTSQLDNLLKSDPGDAEIKKRLVFAFNASAWLRATSWDESIRSGASAVEFASKNYDLTGGKVPALLDTLAAAYAESGRFPEAVSWQKKALLLGMNDLGFVVIASRRLTLYEANKPYREPKPERRTATTSSPSRQ